MLPARHHFLMPEREDVEGSLIRDDHFKIKENEKDMDNLLSFRNYFNNF